MTIFRMSIKYNTVAAIFVAVISTLSLQSCDLDINVNPNRPSESESKFLLPPAILKLANYETVTLNELGAFWGGYWGKANDINIGGMGATNSYIDMIINYSISDDFAVSIWQNAYSNLYNIKLIEDQEIGVNPAYAGISKIMRGWYFLRLVDHYNNVPFYEASNPAILSAKYDDGQLVYREATDLITEGIDLLKNIPVGTQVPAVDDILFKGNMESWRQLGNTLKLRALLRQSEVASADYISQQMAVIAQEGSGFLHADALADPGYSTNTNQMNGFWSSFYRSTNNNTVAAYEGYRPTRYLIQKYEEVNDPRLASVYVAVDGRYNGVILGATNDDSQNSAVTSAFKGPSENNGKPAGLFKSPTQGALVFSAAESYFLQSEAAFRGWLKEDVNYLYASAIRASFRYLGISENEDEVYLSQRLVALSEASNKLSRIIEQKWLALNGVNGAEAWNDFRRLGMPSIPGSLAVSANGSVHPVRLRYPSSEVNNNASQVDAQGNIVGTDLSFRVFWHK